MSATGTLCTGRPAAIRTANPLSSSTAVPALGVRPEYVASSIPAPTGSYCLISEAVAAVRRMRVTRAWTSRSTRPSTCLRTSNARGIGQGVLFGGSWGSTLGLAYAERHPQRVTAIVLVGVTTTRRSEIDWLYRGVAPVFPAPWGRFRAFAPPP